VIVVGAINRSEITDEATRPRINVQITSGIDPGETGDGIIHGRITILDSNTGSKWYLDEDMAFADTGSFVIGGSVTIGSVGYYLIERLGGGTGTGDGNCIITVPYSVGSAGDVVGYNATNNLWELENNDSFIQKYYKYQSKVTGFKNWMPGLVIRRRTNETDVMLSGSIDLSDTDYTSASISGSELVSQPFYMNYWNSWASEGSGSPTNNPPYQIRVRVFRLIRESTSINPNKPKLTIDFGIESGFDLPRNSDNTLYPCNIDVQTISSNQFLPGDVVINDGTSWAKVTSKSQIIDSGKILGLVIGIGYIQSPYTPSYTAMILTGGMIKIPRENSNSWITAPAFGTVYSLYGFPIYRYIGDDVFEFIYHPNGMVTGVQGVGGGSFDCHTSATTSIGINSSGSFKLKQGTTDYNYAIVTNVTDSPIPPTSILFPGGLHLIY
jgi:hypothetical protein